MLKVIGIHKCGDIKKNINIGTFIGVIYNEINNNLNIESNNINNNNNEIKNNINIIDETKILNLKEKYLGDEGIQIFNFNNYINIAELDLSGNYITDIKVLEKVKFNKLEKLYLYANKITNDINILEKFDFKELKELNLSENQISDIKILEKVNFKELKKLDLSYNNISDIEVLEKVKFEKLEEMGLTGNEIDLAKNELIILKLKSLFKRFII